VNGESRDPRVALRNASSEPIPANERVAFADARAQVMALMQSRSLIASAESAKVRQAGGARQ